MCFLNKILKFFKKEDDNERLIQSNGEFHIPKNKNLKTNKNENEKKNSFKKRS